MLEVHQLKAGLVISFETAFKKVNSNQNWPEFYGISGNSCAESQELTEVSSQTVKFANDVYNRFVLILQTSE